MHPSSTEPWNRLDSIYRPLLRRWSTRWGLQDADAEDLVQEVFGELQKLLPTFQHSGQPGAFRCWLRTILAKRVHAFHRRSFRFKERSHPLAAELEVADSSLARLWDKEHDEHVIRCVWEFVDRTVTKERAEVFRLAIAREMTSKEIADKFGMSTTAVWKIKSRILKQLREEFQGLFEID